MKNFIIGITGTYCSGKNFVSRLLEKRGLPALDIDKLGHEAIENEKESILKRFGNDLAGSDRTIDRKKLGERVFGRPRELAALENIVHPAVLRMMNEWIAVREGKPCVINAALLHRIPFENGLKAIILVRAPVLTRILRAKRRDRRS